MYYEKSSREGLSVLCVVCHLVLRCQGKACLFICCLSPGVLIKTPGEGMSVGFVTCMGQGNAQVRTHTFFQSPKLYSSLPPPLPSPFTFLLYTPYLLSLYIHTPPLPPIFQILLFSLAIAVYHTLYFSFYHYYFN